MRDRMTKREGIKLDIQNPSRSCVRVESGLTRIPKICIHDYKCRHCAFDQWIEEMEVRALSLADFGLEKDFLAKAA